MWEVLKLPPPPEKDIQISLMAWMSMVKYEGQAVGNLAFAIPNGANLAGDGRARAMQMASMKRQGLKPGVPDLFVAIARGAYHGLFIELKRDAKSAVSDDQIKWQKRLRLAGFKAEICRGFDEAQACVKRYLNI